MKFINKFIILILIVSCSNKPNTLEQYANYPVKFAKQKITHPNNDFSLFIPMNWEWKSDGYENDNILLGIEANSKQYENGFSDLISIQKIKSFGEKKDLKSEFEYCLNVVENNFGDKTILESGLTKILDKEAYFIHTVSNTETYGEAEIISLIVEGNNKGEFYNLNAVASKTTDLKKNMAVLINCLKTFENLNNE
ncbi:MULTISPECIES: hypothetical protein [unclassified Flavobacterium]|uniref:hypothetical protein n=1 Tax=unclassified Flavobacterium TaxID=196869 RepID=UPI0012927BC4|nr:MULTISPECIES: hypothetical protein [unclassified Flavobacterium]MQP53745.1 hypothetical protein [Flavobacterium sp. LMO9]MQP63637.1 hypothetical protein [Flavobacterium sp. LMO6]